MNNATRTARIKQQNLSKFTFIHSVVRESRRRINNKYLRPRMTVVLTKCMLHFTLAVALPIELALFVAINRNPIPFSGGSKQNLLIIIMDWFLFTILPHVKVVHRLKDAFVMIP